MEVAVVTVRGKVAVINAGSSTLKCALFERNHSFLDPPICKEILEKKGEIFISTIDRGIESWGEDLFSASEAFLKRMLGEFGEIQAIGHRIVHGGTQFIHPVKISSSVIQEIQRLSSLAPLHNPFNLEGIRLAKKIAPLAIQIALFDTAFHHTLPPSRYTYAVPLEWCKKGLRRYGFHGISHEACIEYLKTIYKKKLPKRIITAHLGSGSSLTAVFKGCSIDTTMGFTPMEGLVMGTRSGSIDPGLIFHQLREGKYLPEGLEDLLNRFSGLKGLSGTNDMRELLDRKEKGDQGAILAIEIYCLSAAKQIGALTASLEGLDLLAFTGGIGENAPFIRKKICQSLGFLGIELADDREVSEGVISSSKSRVEVHLIKSREEAWIAETVRRLLK